MGAKKTDKIQYNKNNLSAIKKRTPQKNRDLRDGEDYYDSNQNSPGFRLECGLFGKRGSR